MLASAIGSALEWYDFFIYGTAAALVFGELFFPKLDPAHRNSRRFATFGVGFFARPFGGMVFGHFGDRIGRKPMLVVTLLLVGVAHISDRPDPELRPASASGRRSCWWRCACCRVSAPARSTAAR